MSPEIVGLGEALWDVFPTGRVFGGAPCNFAFHCNQLGHLAAPVTRVGADPDGDAMLAAIRDLGLVTDFVQIDPDHPTGSVTISLSDGQPSYVFAADVAWDYLDGSSNAEALMRSAKAVCFGSLAQRSPMSRATVRRLLAAASGLVVFDVNLRQHFYDAEVIDGSLKLSRWVKLNEEELAILAALLDFRSTDETGRLAELRERYGLELACVTKGADGCRVQTATETVTAPGLKVTVADTVGSGDAFTAALVCLTLEGRPLPEAVRFANRLAAQVAASPGACPRINRSMVERE